MQPFYWIVGMFVGTCLLVFIGYKTLGWLKRCPSCERRWARRNLGSKEVGRRGGYETVTRHDNRYDASGKMVGATYRQEQVHMTTVINESLFECIYCHHKWTKLWGTKHEG